MPEERRPAILAVDDEPAVLSAVARDLRRAFGERFRVLKASSGQEALDLIGEVQLRGDQIALLVADQRMPGMQGTEFLTKAREIVPDAKRVLLTAYADTKAAIDAVNVARLDYYLTKPWHPPEDKFNPVLEDLLVTWERRAELENHGVRLIGHRFSRESHDLRDFLARNRVPAQWIDVETDSDRAQTLLQASKISDDRLPVAVLEDGTVLEQPSISDLAAALGVSSNPAQEHYDLIIVGGGPAGLAGAVYGASEGLKTVMVEREAPGGQAGQSSRIENYLGFPTGVSGSDLADRATTQATRLGAEILSIQDAVTLKPDGSGRFVELSNGATLSGNCVLIASGVSYRQMEAEGFSGLTGRGVYYGAALTEAKSCEQQHVVVIGAGNSAGQAAVYFSEYAAKVTMLVRGPSLVASMSQYLIEQIEKLENVEVKTGASAVAARGEDHLEGLIVKEGDREIEVECSACFVFIGAAPRTDWLEGVVDRDEKGFILSGLDARNGGWPLKRDPYPLETSVPGVFVAGDVRARSVKRVAGAVGEGSMSVSLVHQYLADG